MRRFYIEKAQVAGKTAEITGMEARHIRTVLRMQAGDRVELVDGSGYAYEARIQYMDGDRIQAAVIDRYRSETESPLELTVALGFLKEKKMDFLVRHLTELGITRFIPVWTERAIARPPEKRVSSRLERWRSIAREAVKQSRRARLPEIAAPVCFDEALKLSSGCDERLIFWEMAKEPFMPIADTQKKVRAVYVLLGPEGGFTEKEARAALDYGFTSLAMGPRILRAETAAITACALIQYRFGDMGKKTP